MFAVPIEFFLSDPFHPRVDDVYSSEYHSIPSLLHPDRRERISTNIRADVVVTEVTDTIVVFYMYGGKREQKPLKEWRAFISTSGYIPQYTLRVFNLYITHSCTEIDSMFVVYV